jgi:copper chaperone CopZ
VTGAQAGLEHRQVAAFNQCRVDLAGVDLGDVAVDVDGKKVTVRASGGIDAIKDAIGKAGYEVIE